VDPFKQYPILEELLKPFWKRHKKTLALVIAAIASAGQARSFAIATCISSWIETRLDSAVNRFYRLLRNENIDYTDFASSWAKLLAKRTQGHLLVSIDWTEWHHQLRMLMAAVVVGKRAVPLFAQVTRKLVGLRSQNSYENTFLRVLADLLKRAKVTVTILCDRGFRRVSWIALLQKLELGFAVRLKDDVFVCYKGKMQSLKQLGSTFSKGKVIDLGVVSLRADSAVNVRIVFYWAKKAKTPWWIATSEKGSPSQVIALYDRRMTVEEQFRDTKGKRFGIKLLWTQFRDPEALARFIMLLAVALIIWMVTGTRAAENNPSLRLVCRKKGPRQSFVTIGLRIITANPYAVVLTLAFLKKWLEPPHKRSLTAGGIGGAK
jgi:hypothetical protein